jgi:hypothetical protein
MPWTPNDGPARHTKKANSPVKKRQWSDVANSVRTREMAAGASEKVADASAVRTANGVVKNRGSKRGG